MSLNETISANKALIDIFTEQSEKLEKADEAGNADAERMGKIREIYSADNDEAMLSVILETYQKMRSEYTEECKAHRNLRTLLTMQEREHIPVRVLKETGLRNTLRASTVQMLLRDMSGLQP